MQKANQGKPKNPMLLWWEQKEPVLKWTVTPETGQNMVKIDMALITIGRMAGEGQTGQISKVIQADGNRKGDDENVTEAFPCQRQKSNLYTERSRSNWNCKLARYTWCHLVAWQARTGRVGTRLWMCCQAGKSIRKTCRNFPPFLLRCSFSKKFPRCCRKSD